jgi:pterin-4a-carbinolamine dehydratase
MKTIDQSFQTFHVEYMNKESRDIKNITKKDFLKAIAFLLCIETLDNRIVHIPDGKSVVSPVFLIATCPPLSKI